MQPHVLVVIGASGSGKTSLVAELERRRRLVVTPTWTTRPRRRDEVHGCVNHRFVDEATFDALDATGFFLGTARLAGLPYRYGQPHVRQTGDGRLATLVARAMAVPLIRQHCPDCLVYQIEAPRERTAAALAARGLSPTEAAARLAALDEECAAGRSTAERIFVNDGSFATLLAAVSEAINHDFTLERNAR